MQHEENAPSAAGIVGSMGMSRVLSHKAILAAAFPSGLCGDRARGHESRRVQRGAEHSSMRSWPTHFKRRRSHHSLYAEELGAYPPKSGHYQQYAAVE